MRPIRQRLSWLLSLWLMCQVVALAAPAVLVAAGSAPVQELCTCPGGDHETCPMHHGSAANQDGGQLCAMQSACAPVDVALLSMAGGAGVLPESIVIARSPQTSTIVPIRHLTLDIPSTHDTPPPRF